MRMAEEIDKRIAMLTRLNPPFTNIKLDRNPNYVLKSNRNTT